MKVVFVNDAGQASEFTPDADGKICYGKLADGHYVVQVENGEEIINLFELSIATEEPEEPENPDQTEQPEEPEQPDNSETPDDNNVEDKNEEQPEEKGSLGLILGAVIFVLVVAGGIVTVVILKKKNKKN